MAAIEGEFRPKRQYVRIREKKRCIVKYICTKSKISEAMFVETSDHSKGGLSLIYDEKILSVGNRVFIYIESLNIFKKEAEVVWSSQLDDAFKSGLKWD